MDANFSVHVKWNISGQEIWKLTSMVSISVRHAVILICQFHIFVLYGAPTIFCLFSIITPRPFIQINLIPFTQNTLCQLWWKLPQWSGRRRNRLWSYQVFHFHCDWTWANGTYICACSIVIYTSHQSTCCLHQRKLPVTCIDMRDAFNLLLQNTL